MELDFLPALIMILNDLTVHLMQNIKKKKNHKKH